jgi:3-deoxy-D-manno-octulosonic acid kinase
MAESRTTQIACGDCPDKTAMGSVERVELIADSVILYDDTLTDHIRAEWFEPSFWPDAPVAPGYAGGRGATLFIRCREQNWVLRHYHRSGVAGRLASDGYIWMGEARTRSFCEWRVLAGIHRLGLPAPRPVAARYVRHGPLYTADLITVRIPDVVPLSTRLAQGLRGDQVWWRTGECVGRFHAAFVCHADLTAHNLQISSSDQMFLLDFDRGRIMPGDGLWRRRNLERLHRSLTKISRDGAVAFREQDWETLLAGYRSACPLPAVAA